MDIPLENFFAQCSSAGKFFSMPAKIFFLSICCPITPVEREKISAALYPIFPPDSSQIFSAVSLPSFQFSARKNQISTMNLKYR